MENYPRPQDKESPSPLPSSPPPLTPKPISMASETNPYPTTFVQADTNSFKQVVQMLTGSAETAAAAAAAKNPPSPSCAGSGAKGPPGPKRPPFKLYERRNTLKNLKIISPLMPAFRNSNHNSPRNNQPEILSPSLLDFPSLVLSPVTPLIPDPFGRGPLVPGSEAAIKAEEKAIAEKGFYLHPSPRAAEPPRLLPLFPLASPRVSSSPSP
ncbi:VQ motif-containing protein 4-like [Typha latifolia]|uniref:VQ motif-containing protein 4-like n=1 Tax=Typha latifolia TaxID=4733 RepID=UPI003C2B3F7C